MQSRYRYDADGRLRDLRHSQGQETLAQFQYEVDANGNRTEAREYLMPASAVNATQTYAYNHPDITFPHGTWVDEGHFKVADGWASWLKVRLVANSISFTYGTGPDHSMFDVYVGGSLWQSVDGYATERGEATLTIPLRYDGPLDFEIRNRQEKNLQSTGYVVRFKQVQATSKLTTTSIHYTYDSLERLLNAVYANTRSYAYQYDIAGNRTQEQVTIGMTTTTTNWTYNNANQISTMQIGSNPITNFTYDANGNMLSDGQLTYIWNRANRLITTNNGAYNTHYAYTGDGDRVRQTVGGAITDYILDTQPELALVLQASTASETLSYMHTPMGLQAVENSAGDWHYHITDGLGSVRGQVDAFHDMTASQMYDPYGQAFDVTGNFVGDFGFAGEQMNDSGLSYNRARYYNPAMGMFTALDPFEGLEERPMSMNGYSYAENNPANWTDPSGEFINIVAGAISGAVIGGALGMLFGVTQAEMTYYLAINGRCGCEKQQEMLDYGYTNFVRDFKRQGAIFGATLGSVMGAGGPLASLIGPALATIGLAQSVETVVGLLDDFFQDGRIDNECRWVDFAFDLLDIAIGKSLEIGNQRTVELAQNSHTPSTRRVTESANSSNPNRVRTARRSGAEQSVDLSKRRIWRHGIDLSKVRKRLANILGSSDYGISSFQCHHCADLVGQILKAEGYTVEIVQIRNKVDPLFGKRFDNMAVRLPDGRIHIIADSGWHEAVRIIAGGEEFYLDSLVYAHKDVSPVQWSEYMTFWEDGNYIEITSVRPVP